MTPVALDTKTLKASLLAAVLAVAFCCAACGAEQSEAAQERESKPTPTADENSAPEIVGTKVPPAEPLAKESPSAPEESPAARDTATATQNESPYERSAGVEPTFSSSGTDATEEDAPPARGEARLYLQMTEDEKREFIERRARHVSRMISSGTYEFGGDAVTLIKQYVDVYAQRVGNRSTATWGEDLNYVFGRAQRYAPTIIRAFNGRHVPPAIGLYIVAVETEYTNFPSNNFAGAAGLFQFVGDTAEQYHVPRGERTNVEKMAPAAASYIADRIAEFGTDPMSVALGIAGYNRSPDSVRNDLRSVLNSKNKERSFWTLVANSDKLDHYFQGENVKYVPKFFAAAIVGETPWAFGLEMKQPLSTQTEPAGDAQASGRRGRK